MEGPVRLSFEESDFPQVSIHRSHMFKLED